jgi:hypothetical protein
MQKIVYIVFVFTTGLMSAQAQGSLLAQGDKFMTWFQFDKAAAIYKKAADIKNLIAIGYGEEKIRNKCVDEVPCTEEEHGYNRRTEFKVLKFD